MDSRVTLAEVAAQGASGEGRWYPLTGVKSGQILLTADFLPLGGGGDSADPVGALAAAKRLRDSLEAGGKKSSSNDPRLMRADSKGRLADGTLAGGAAGVGLGGVLPGLAGRDGAGPAGGVGGVSPGLAGRDGAGPAGGVGGVSPGLAGALAGGKNPLEGFEGDLVVHLVKGRNLVKADIMGKSDPYAVLKFGKQKEKTNTIKNTLEPQWDFSTNFKVPDGDANTLR